ncbi:hypothetical protein AWJ20_1862 [Sugiyamaella lignohabitans]|uniref:Kinetochore protein Sos7 coiled-coil domain-containing protein n=1 Tax=Sugiyamaella lignohabitans TaxID=796027 RepID=A0A167E2K9_9ASCO|nr:uncharacterized protein AWJ20_1862 [Sugiyamaella lignohabitans]ANB13566.1 hypothetical protein AWJ20_1862 [Sugiyamaella lignohabitans]
MSLLEPMIRESDLNIFQLKEDYLKRITPDSDKKNTSKHKLHTNPRQFDLDIQRYEELFDTRKLTYLEQETKERFLRAIINDPPFFVEQWDMKDVEEKTKGKKLRLKEEKAKSKELLAGLDKQARDIYSEYKLVNATNERTNTLYREIDEMQREFQRLQEEYPQLQIPDHPDPQLNISSVEELDILENDYLSEIQDLDDEILKTSQSIDEALAMQIQLEKDIEKLRTQRENIDKNTKEVVRIRNEELKATDKDMELTADFYRNMVECLLEISELQNFNVSVSSHNSNEGTILRVNFVLAASPAVKFNLYINDVTGELLPQSTVSNVKSSIVEEALSHVSHAPLSTQAELFVKRIRQNL